MPDRVRLTVPSEPRSLALVAAVARTWCDDLEIPDEEAAEVVSVVDEAVRFTLANAYPDDPTGEIELTLDLVDLELHVDVHDWGRPLAGDVSGGGLRPELQAIGLRVDSIRLINLGADGKRINIRKAVSHALDTGPEAHDFGAPARPTAVTGVEESVDIRDGVPQDAEAISQLLYENYHLSYGHPDFYRPRWLADELERGRILSTVAVHRGEVIGHHAVMLADGSTSAESGAAVVHSAFRGLGVFGRLFDHTLSRASEAGLEAVYGRAVTVHPYSQRSERSHGYRETALLLGSVPATMTMKGLDGPRPGSRTASLLSYRLLRPVARNPVLPALYAPHLRGAYAHGGLSLGMVEAPVETEGHDPVSLDEDHSRATAVLTVAAWDARALAHALRTALAHHHDVVYVDVDLQTGAATPEALDHLNDEGFFYAGLVPCGPAGHDYLRLQLPNAENIETEKIVCDSPFAKALLADVLADAERVAR